MKKKKAEEKINLCFEAEQDILFLPEWLWKMQDLWMYAGGGND